MRYRERERLLYAHAHRYLARLAAFDCASLKKSRALAAFLCLDSLSPSYIHRASGVGSVRDVTAVISSWDASQEYICACAGRGEAADDIIGVFAAL